MIGNILKTIKTHFLITGFEPATLHWGTRSDQLSFMSSVQCGENSVSFMTENVDRIDR